MLPEIFLTPVSQPDPQDLGHFLPICFAQGFIERHSLLPLAPAGGIAVSIPETARLADHPTGFLDQSCTGQRYGVGFLLGGHEKWMEGLCLSSLDPLQQSTNNEPA